MECLHREEKVSVEAVLNDGQTVYVCSECNTRWTEWSRPDIIEQAWKKHKSGGFLTNDELKLLHSFVLKMRLAMGLLGEHGSAMCFYMLSDENTLHEFIRERGL